MPLAEQIFGDAVQAPNVGLRRIHHHPGAITTVWSYTFRRNVLRNLAAHNAFHYLVRQITNDVPPGLRMRFQVALPNGRASYIKQYVGPRLVARGRMQYNPAFWRGGTRVEYEKIDLTPALINEITRRLEATAEALVTSNDNYEIGDITVNVELREAPPRRRGGAPMNGADKVPAYLQGRRGIEVKVKSTRNRCFFEAAAWSLCGNAVVQATLGLDVVEDPNQALRNMRRRGGMTMRTDRLYDYFHDRALDLPPLDEGFVWEVHGPRFVELFPTVKLVCLPLVGYDVTGRDVLTGTEWRPLGDERGLVANRSDIVYVIHDRHKQHYWLVSDPQLWAKGPGHEGSRYNWCHGCYRLVPSVNRTLATGARHRCREAKCVGCNGFFESEEALLAHKNKDNKGGRCQYCDQPTYSSECLGRHLGMCPRTHTKCHKCDEMYRKDALEPHECRGCRCRNCGIRYNAEEGGHSCFIQQLYTKLPKPHQLDEHITTQVRNTWVYDFESMFVGDDREHVVNFVAMRNCLTKEEKVFPDLAGFVAEVTREDYEGCYFYAHNARSYDARLLYDHMVKVTKSPPQDVMWNGQKIMAMVRLPRQAVMLQTLTDFIRCGLRQTPRRKRGSSTIRCCTFRHVWQISPRRLVSTPPSTPKAIFPTASTCRRTKTTSASSLLSNGSIRTSAAPKRRKRN